MVFNKIWFRKAVTVDEDDDIVAVLHHIVDGDFADVTSQEMVLAVDHLRMTHMFRLVSDDDLLDQRVSGQNLSAVHHLTGGRSVLQI